jgi:murein L,D-transpeptidase YcbB/YkuD
MIRARYIFQIPATPRLLLFLVALVVCLPACKNRNHSASAANLPIHIPESDEQFNLEMQEILRDHIPTLSAGKQAPDTSIYTGWQEVVKDIYQANGNLPVWVSKNILSARGNELFKFVNTAEFFGLNKDLYGVNELNRLHDSLQKMSPTVNFELAKKLETGLTRAFCEIALHLEHGMFVDSIQGINSNFRSARAKYAGLLGQIIRGSSVDSTLHTLEPQNPIYDRYMKSLKDFVSKNNISSEPIHIRDPKTDSAGAVTDARAALVIHHYLPDSLKNNDSAYKASLLQFQKDNGLNPDGKIGLMTQKALERGNAFKFQLLAINADRWRQYDIKIPERYVWVNLAAAKLRIIERDSMKMEKNVVIGKADKEHKTPTLESSINTIVLWPTWTVPQSIVKKEMKSFKGYIVNETNGYKQVIQPPGPNNSLGVVKILFPNKYSVYLHDTPSKYLFKSDYRAHSHGCVRCQDALEVAAYLMQMDTFRITYDSLLALKQEKIATQSFRLKKPIPVFFKYFTAEADWSGKLHFYTDVYKRDTEMIAYVFEKKKPANPVTSAKKAVVKAPVPGWQSIPIVDRPSTDTLRTLPDSTLN